MADKNGNFGFPRDSVSPDGTPVNAADRTD